jgi:hypothetical protein
VVRCTSPTFVIALLIRELRLLEPRGDLFAAQHPVAFRELNSVNVLVSQS